GLARKAGDLDIPETMEGETRHIDFFAFPLEDVLIHLPCGLRRARSRIAVVGAALFDLAADRGHAIECAIRVEQLSGPQADARAGGTLHPQPNPAGEVLPQVKDPYAGLWLRELDRLEHPGDPNRRRGLRSQRTQRLSRADRLLPSRIVEPRPVPPRLFFPRIIDLAQ